ncbi:phospholipid scramblase 1-like isoform X1, partial [Aphelenchoides avenae]
QGWARYKQQRDQDKQTVRQLIGQIQQIQDNQGITPLQECQQIMQLFNGTTVTDAVRQQLIPLAFQSTSNAPCASTSGGFGGGFGGVNTGFNGVNNGNPFGGQPNSFPGQSGSFGGQPGGFGGQQGGFGGQQGGFGGQQGGFGGQPGGFGGQQGSFGGQPSGFGGQQGGFSGQQGSFGGSQQGIFNGGGQPGGFGGQPMPGLSGQQQGYCCPCCQGGILTMPGSMPQSGFGGQQPNAFNGGFGGQPGGFGGQPGIFNGGMSGGFNGGFNGGQFGGQPFQADQQHYQV